MNLALSESLGQELRFAKRIKSNGVMKLELRSNEVQILTVCIQILMDRGDPNEEVGIGFVGFG